MSMENVRRPRPPRVRIERLHAASTTSVVINGVDMSNHVSAVTWSQEAGKLPTATVTFLDAEIDVVAEDVGTDPASIATCTITVIKSHPMLGEYWQAMCSCGGGVTMMYTSPEAARDASRGHKPGMRAADWDAAEAKAAGNGSSPGQQRQASTVPHGNPSSEQ